MAYGDFASLLPAEAYYQGAGGKLDAAKVESQKKASYLSSMDQFYAQLSEMERQFDVTSILAREQFEFESGERFDWEKEYGTTKLGLEKEALEIPLRTAQIGARVQTEAARYQYELGMKELEWKEKEAESTQEFLENYFKRQGAQKQPVTSGDGTGQSTEDWLLQKSRQKEADELGIDLLDLY